MKINSIKYKNFRNFKEEGLVSFSTDGRVSIVYGMNGDGKTTFHQLFQWIIYGETHFNKTTTDKMYNLELEQEQPINSKFNVCGEINFEHKNKNNEIEQYCIIREWIYQKNIKDSQKIDEKFILLKKNENDDWKLVENPEEKIEEMLPKSLSEYFFFDGESMVADLKVKGKDSALKLKKTLYSMFNMNLYQNASIHIGAAEKKGSVIGTIFAEKTNSNKSEIQELKKEIDATQRQIEKLEISINEREKNCANFRKRIKELSEIIGSVDTKTNYEEKREEYKSQINGLQKIIENTKMSFGDDVSKTYPQLLLYKAVENAKKRITLKIETEKLIPGVSKNLIDSLCREKNCLCGQLMTEEIKSKLADYYRLLPPLSYKGIYDDFKKNINRYMVDYDSELLLNHIQNIISCQNSIEKAVKECDDIDAKLRENEKIQDYIDERKSCENELEYESEKINKDKSELQKYNIWLKNRYSKLNEQTKYEANNDIIDRKIRIMEIVKKYFDDRLQEVSISYSHKLQDEIQFLLRKMLTSERNVQMTPDFFFRVYDNFGDESKSEGQFAVISFAYIAAIMKILKEEETLKEKEYPLILDGPFSKLDPVQKQNVINTIPECAPQIIVFSKDNLNDLFGPEKIGKIWTIQSNKQKNVAKIREGFLWK